MSFDLDALQELPAQEEQAGLCGFTCATGTCGTVSCPSTCPVTGE